ncbi:SDR family NAD(P)-dependent oxidoreductase [Echinicola shivajiensis]|uniref:SDR family NAD(P)-dependent oxidoreductase n=1 Tax=Echinicola shivajiensis TaxID=1035916 RepID=UPI001BFC30EB|nr:SDR family NAD(P)-dependent oxidoreductase [Echinicola shivajiensis]
MALKVLISGPTSGTGKYLANFLAYNSFETILLGRNMEEMQDLEAFKSGNCKCFETNLASMDSLKQSIFNIKKEVDQIDIIINNAGILGYDSPRVDERGVEATFQVNYLAHYYLVSELAELFNSQRTRLFNMCSRAAFWYHLDAKDFQSLKAYQPMKAYGRSKKMLMMLGKWMADNPAYAHVEVYNIDPGTFKSGISRSRGLWFRFLYEIARSFMRRPENACKEIVEIIQGMRTFPSGALIKNGAVKSSPVEQHLLNLLIEESTALTGSDIRAVKAFIR